MRGRLGGASDRAVRVLMVLFIAAGVPASTITSAANVEFQRETDPALRGRALLMEALEAKVPPALAPGVMLQLGLVGSGVHLQAQGAVNHEDEAAWIRTAMRGGRDDDGDRQLAASARRSGSRWA